MIIDAINAAIANNDARELFLALEAEGVTVTFKGNRDADDAACEIDGYGTAWFDEQDGVEPGWVVTGYSDAVDYPMDDDELADEIRALLAGQRLG